MLLTILLPVHNNINYTKVTLKELNNHTAQASSYDIKIIVIDDGSTDGTYDWIKTNFPNVVVLKGDGGLWWSGAINLGAAYAFDVLLSDFILLWNNDIVIEKNYFFVLNNILNTFGGDTIIGSKVMVHEDPEKVWSMGGYFNPKTGEYGMFGYYEKDSADYNSIAYADWLTGMGTFIHREVVEKIGFWDNVNFPQYHGDSDFTYRAKKQGYKIIVDPSLIIYNSVKNSGIEHEGNLKQLVRLFTDIKSKSNISKNIMFYRLHAESIRAFIPLFWSYFKILGGFFKWKIFKFFGLKKKNFS